MSIQAARNLLREFCKPVNYFSLILELAAEKNIPDDGIWYLIESGEYGVGKYNDHWMIRRSKLYIPKIPKNKLGIDKDVLIAAVDAAQVFATELGVTVKDRKWQSLLCPFHEEQNPSFRILLPDGGYICRGCEERGGNVINFVQALHHLSFPIAIEYLARNYTTIEVKHD
jgi:hypothetical protein